MTKISYQQRESKFQFRLAVPIGFQNKLDADLRYYRNAKEYRPVLLKEASVNGFFLAILFGAFAWLNANTMRWEYYLPFAALVIILFIGMIYKRRVNKLHKKPQEIYRQVEQLFEGSGIENDTLTEQSAYCFKFRKNDMDCEFTYNIYRKAFHFYIYPPADVADFEAKADQFVEDSKGNWFYDEDEDGNFLACTLTNDSLQKFYEILMSDTLLAKELFSDAKVSTLADKTL